MTKKLKTALLASVLAGSFSCIYADWFSSTPKSTYEKADVAYKNGDDNEAARLYELSCVESDFHGCNDAAYMYQYGRGVGQNLSKARELYTKACNGGFSHGCDNLKELRAESQYQPSNNSNSGHPGEMCERNGGSWTWNGNVNQWMCYQNNQQANSRNSNYQQQQAYQQEQLRIQQEQLAIQRQQLEMQQEQNRQRNVNGVLNSINGLNQTIGNMNNQMQQRNNNFNGFDASKGLNFNRY